jgi:penicillin amidase
MLNLRAAGTLFAAVVVVLSAPAWADTPIRAKAGINAVRPVQVAGLQAAVQVKTDVDGIPHILANNERDMVLIQGWVHARDRLFQMDLTRRQASGTLAELVGNTALASDVELRTIGLRRAAERSLAALSDETRDLLQAYADGVNAYVASHPLPPEYGLLELATFEPWTPTDSVVVAKAIAFSLSFDLDISLTETLIAYQTAGTMLGFDGIALFFEDLLRSAPFDPASTVPDASIAASLVPGDASDRAAASSATSPGALPGGLSPVTIRLAAEYANRVRDLPLFEGSLEPGRRSKGSNEWGVGGEHTASGQPLMANDPHLSLNTPSTFYQVHLVSTRDRIDVIGSGFAGVPFVIIGQNKRITWGATTNPMDVTDTYQEQVVPDPTSPSGLSTVYMGTPEPIIPLPQEFRFNQIGDGIFDNLAVAPPGGGIPEFVLIVPRRNMGPIVALDVDTGFGLSVQYTGFSGTREVEAFREWNRAGDLDEFVAGMQLFDFGSQNWSYADVDGNTAYFTSAELPLREDLQAETIVGLPPYFIRNGTGGNEWLPVTTPQPGQGVPYEVLPFEEMPQIVNPPAGFYVNANNDPIGTTLDNNPLNQLRPGGGIYYLNPGYAIGCRAGRITQALQQRLAAGPITAEDMAAIQADVVLLDPQVFTPYILEAFANGSEPGADPMLAALAADPRIVEAAGRLADWDYSMPTGIPEGYDASDEDGVPAPPDADEIAASVAATIYSVWRGQMIANTIDAVVDAIGIPRPGSSQAVTALRNLLDSFDVMQGFGASGLDFFQVPGAIDRNAARDIVILQSLADALDLLAGPNFADAFGSSTDQNDYRWGRLHRIVLDHPLGGPFDIPPAGGAFPPPLPDLAGIPVDGGFNAVDASSHSARAASSNAFMFGGGPVRRYVGGPVRSPWRIEGRTILPGGESGDLSSPFYANLLGRWLTNETYPMRQRLGDINQALYRHEVFNPGNSDD